MPDCGVHYLWFAFVCFLIRSHPPPLWAGSGGVGLREWPQGVLGAGGWLWPCEQWWGSLGGQPRARRGVAIGPTKRWRAAGRGTLLLLGFSQRAPPAMLGQQRGRACDEANGVSQSVPLPRRAYWGSPRGLGRGGLKPSLGSATNLPVHQHPGPGLVPSVILTSPQMDTRARTHARVCVNTCCACNDLVLPHSSPKKTSRSNRSQIFACTTHTLHGNFGSKVAM